MKQKKILACICAAVMLLSGCGASAGAPMMGSDSKSEAAMDMVMPEAPKALLPSKPMLPESFAILMSILLAR